MTPLPSRSCGKQARIPTAFSPCRQIDYEQDLPELREGIMRN